MGIEPTCEAWEAPILPLNYARIGMKSNAKDNKKSRGGKVVFLITFIFKMQAAKIASKAEQRIDRYSASGLNRLLL